MSEAQAKPDLLGDQGTTGTPGLTPRLALHALRQHFLLLTVGPLCVGLLALGVTFLVPPVYTASVTFIPPQQAQSGVAAALASLGPLAGLAGAGGGGRNSPDLYAALLQRATLTDRMVDEFKLKDLYNAKFREDARRKLAKKTRITIGKRDGLVTIEVDDVSPVRAADMANRYVEELRRVISTLAVSEAQQRRKFFEEQLRVSHERLVNSQQALQASGFNQGAMKTEPRAAADSYAKIRAEVAASEVRLQALRGALTDAAPEVRQQQATLKALQSQLLSLERANSAQGGSDYVSRYREFKYSEALFDVYARQFELARMDESREGALIQVVDPAVPPERRSSPKRAQTAVIATLASGLLLAVGVLWVRRNGGRLLPLAPQASPPPND